MAFIILGACAFVLYFLYDINSVTMRKRFLFPAFGIGCILLVISTAGLVKSSWEQERFLSVGGMLLAVLCMVFGGLLIYTLFFALPFKTTYIKKEKERAKPTISSKGMYALCRHPAVLWLIGLFIVLGAEFPTAEMMAGGTLFCVLDILYVIFQDLWTFPREFENYDEYRRRVPFLIPNAKSIRNCINTLRGGNEI